jgi:hypothetical protein
MEFLNKSELIEPAIRALPFLKSRPLVARVHVVDQPCRVQIAIAHAHKSLAPTYMYIALRGFLDVRDSTALAHPYERQSGRGLRAPKNEISKTERSTMHVVPSGTCSRTPIL